MSKVKAPKSLRFEAAINSVNQTIENNSGRTVTAVAGLIAVASFSGAEAQQSSLPPVTVDAPVARQRPAAAKPSAAQLRARTALRRAAQRPQATPVAAVPFPNAGGLSADRNPYANPNAPYMATRVQASGKFPEPLLNTPKTITVLTKDVLADQNSTTLRSAVLNTAGVTLGTGEGGNAFGDRFFIRGFDARNDIFVDGIRDAGVSVRENFFTEQVEIHRGPGSSFAGRGTAGGAINIVTKQATTEKSFYNMDTTFATDHTKRVVLDVNQVISPTLAIRAGGLFQDATVAGRSYSKDDRDGGFVAVKWTPLDSVTLWANYIHTNLHGMPDFGVPYYRPGSPAPATGFTNTSGGPFTDFGVNRNTFYGLVNRDYFSTKQDIGTFGGEVTITPDLTLSSKTRVQRSVQDYIGTLPEAPITVTNNVNPFGTLSLNPQSRYQASENVANVTEAVWKSQIGGWKNTLAAGIEYSRELSSIDKYTGLSSEGLPGGSPGGNFTGVNIFAPQQTFAPFAGNAQWTGLPTKTSIDTTSGYLIDTANYNDFVILNGGVRYDNYNVKVSGFGATGPNPNPALWGAQTREDGIPNFNLGLTLKPLPNGSVYVAYATSSNPVGAEFDGTSSQYGGLAPFLPGNPNQSFGPEKNKAIEIGTKWELFDKRLLVTAALFQTEKENARESQNFNNTTAPATLATLAALGCTYSLPITAPTPTNQSCITAGAAYRIQGIDIGIGGKITDKWSVFGGLVLMKSEVTKSLVPSAQPTLFPTNVGLKLANVAHQSFSLLSKYQLTDVWEIGGQAVYRSEMFGGTFLAANQGTSIPSFWRFDTFVEAKVDKNWTAKLFVANITNKLYYDALYQSATPFVFVAPGRSVSMVLSARF